MARTALFYCDEAMQHDTGEYHPESPLRLQAIRNALETHQVQAPLLHPQAASRKDLLRNHSEKYIEMVEHCSKTGTQYPDPDTVISPESWEAALLSAGAGITACKAVLNKEADNAFVLMRPPGHHAEKEYGMGFCLFNNIAIAAHWLRDEGALQRVAIFDFDVHHGNGTQHAFYEDETVLFISIHEYPHFPGTGFPYECGKDNTTLNIQTPPGCSPEQWVTTVQETVLPRLEAFAPEFLLVSAGFDAHRLDPLGNQLLEAEHYYEITRLLRPIANGNIVSLLEGGYHLDALGRSAVQHVRALME